MVSITFDDGYRDNAVTAASVLEEHGLRATFFVSTGFIDGGGPFWFDRAADVWARLDGPGRTRVLDETSGLESNGSRARGGLETATWMGSLKRLGGHAREDAIRIAEREAGRGLDERCYCPMDISQVQRLHQSGHEVGAHTVTHPILTLAEESEVEWEVRTSREMLNSWLGVPVAGFCYPNGDHDERVVTAVRRAGFAYACTTEPGLNLAGGDPFRMKRIDITRRRTQNHRGEYDELAFRSEVCGLREKYRQVLARLGYRGRS